MISKFKLVGLSKLLSMTCEPLNNENTFHPKVKLTSDRFEALWDYCKGDWSNKKFVQISHDGLNSDGTPINPVVLNLVSEHEEEIRRKTSL